MQSAETNRRTSRSLAGKALAIFIVFMAVLTMVNNGLNELAVAQITVVSPQRGALERILEVSGELSAQEVLPIYARAAVHVEKVHVRAGQMVSEGDPLFTLDQVALDELVTNVKDTLDIKAQALNNAQQALIYAKADMGQLALDTYNGRQKAVEKAQASYDNAVAAGGPAATIEYRREVLEDAIQARDRMSSVRDYFAQQTALAEAEKAHGSAQADWEEAQRIASSATVCAPCDGQIIQVNTRVGASASTAEALLTLSPMSGALELLVTVREEQAEYVEAGDEATLTVGTETYQAQVLSVAPSPQQAGQVELAFALPADAGRVGMAADVELRKRSKNYQVLIPLSALREDNLGTYVYLTVQREGALGIQSTLVRTNVTVIDRDATRAAVQGAVTMQDKIVARSDRDVVEGDRVRIKGD